MSASLAFTQPGSQKENLMPYFENTGILNAPLLSNPSRFIVVEDRQLLAFLRKQEIILAKWGSQKVWAEKELGIRFA